MKSVSPSPVQIDDPVMVCLQNR